MATVHQSMLTSWSRCPAAFGYEMAGADKVQTSALSYGTVLHYALLEVFERLRHDGEHTVPQAERAAVETFLHYWHPMNIEAICAPVEKWLPKQDYSTMRERGPEEIRWYVQQMATRDEQVLATEFGFQVPIDGTNDELTGEPHILAGTVDRLAIVRHKGHQVVEVQDLKTGNDYRYLRQNIQFSAYCGASTKKQFWTGWNGEDGFGSTMGAELWQQLYTAARRGLWISTKTKKLTDAGWRGPQDYRRFAIAVTQVVASMRAEIYPLNISGSTCTYCEFKNICAGTGVPEDNHGAPEPRQRRHVA